jgi:hypothetical protein
MNLLRMVASPAFTPAPVGSTVFKVQQLRNLMEVTSSDVYPVAVGRSLAPSRRAASAGISRLGERTMANAYFLVASSICWTLPPLPPYSANRQAGSRPIAFARLFLPVASRSTQQRRKQAIEPDEDRSISDRQLWFRGRPSTKDVQLMPKQHDLGFQLRLRLERRDHDVEDQAQKRDHCQSAYLILILTPARMEYSAGTTSKICPRGHEQSSTKTL